MLQNFVYQHEMRKCFSEQSTYLGTGCFFHSIFELRFRNLIWRKILSLNIANEHRTLNIANLKFGIAYQLLGLGVTFKYVEILL